LAGRLVELGIEGGGNLTDADFTNVLQHQLADELKDVRRCREGVFEVMAAVVFGGAGAIVSAAEEEPQPNINDNLDNHSSSTMSGRPRPPVIDPGYVFSMFVRETVAIRDDLTLLTLHSIESNGGFAHFISTKLDRGTSRDVRAQHGKLFALDGSECNVTLYSVDYEQKMVELILFCSG
jgi:hypothetical protein